jgi:hypothetical protein
VSDINPEQKGKLRTHKDNLLGRCASTRISDRINHHSLASISFFPLTLEAWR